MAAWSLLIVLVGLHVVAAGLVLTHATEDLFVDLDWMRNAGRDTAATQPPATDTDTCTRAAPSQAPGDEEASTTTSTAQQSVAMSTSQECRQESAPDE